MRERRVERVVADERVAVRARVRASDEVLRGRVAEQRAEEQVQLAQAPVQLAPDADAALDAAHERQVPEEAYAHGEHRGCTLDEA